MQMGQGEINRSSSLFGLIMPAPHTTRQVRPSHNLSATVAAIRKLPEPRNLAEQRPHAGRTTIDLVDASSVEGAEEPNLLPEP